MLKNKRNFKEATQLDLFSAFNAKALQYDILIDTLIQQAKNIRYLITKIDYSELKPTVKKFWISDLNELLDLYSETCNSLSYNSNKYIHSRFDDFDPLWAYNESVTMTYSPDRDDILSHHENCISRLSITLSVNKSLLEDIGPIVAKLQEKIRIHRNLFNSYYL